MNARMFLGAALWGKAALAPLFGAAFTVAACYSLGSVITAWVGSKLRRAEKLPLAFVLGASVLHLAVFAVMALHVASLPVLVAVLSVALSSGLVTGDWRLTLEPPPEPRSEPTPRSPLVRIVRYGLGAVTAAFTVLYFFNAWAPELSADGSGYHLGLVARYLRIGGFERVSTNFYAGLSEGVEMLYVPAFAIGRHSAAALVHFAFLIALALAIAAYGRRIGKPIAGIAAALFVYFSPVVGIDGTTAYVDVATAAIVFSVYYWTQIWDESRNDRMPIAIGLLAGYCYAAKYTAFVMLAYAAGFVIWRQRRLRSALVVVACSAVMAAPWAVKNWIYLSNPVAPFGNRIFRNPYGHVETERFWRANQRRYELQSLWALPLEVTVRGDATRGMLGPLFLAAPVALFALRSRSGRRVLAPAALLLATYFANIGTRFLIPALPFVALAMALALESAPGLLVCLVMLHGAASWPQGFHRYANPWALQRIPVLAALRIIPEEQELGAHDDYGWARMIETYVPAGERVLAPSGLPEAYTSRDVLVGYAGALNNNLLDAMEMGISGQTQPAQKWALKFPERKIQRLRIVQTAQAPDPNEQWSVHELRFLRAGAELPRLSTWRLNAFPNPWELARAFDNSEATRWRSWETAAPGMYIDVDFGREEMLDEVSVELSGDEFDIQMRIETMDAQGKWAALSGREEVVGTTVAPGSLERAAAQELRAGGVNYLLVKDSDYGAKDYSARAAAWDLTALIHAYSATLYRVNP